MDRLWPTPAIALDDDELEKLYDYPQPLHRPWVRVNFVSSCDGAVTVGGFSRGLSNPVDKKVFALIRDLADVVLVGVGTALVEGYRGVKASEVRAERRHRFGLSEIPPIALVTRSCSVSPDSTLLTDTLVPPIVITCAAAPEARRTALIEGGAHVLLAGEEDVDLFTALDLLDQRGLRRICCEGGPTLFGALINDNLVDELCLTISPLLTGGDAGRIAHGPLPEQPRELRLASVLAAEETLLTRYVRGQHRV